MCPGFSYEAIYVLGKFSILKYTHPEKMPEQVINFEVRGPLLTWPYILFTKF
jgi:hypothetical protein